MNENLRNESEKLAQSWEQHDAAKLRQYLVASVEDPRINLQSILTRHFLVSLLFGDKFDALKSEEMAFGVCMNWFLAMVGRELVADEWHAILHALEHGSDNAEGVELPAFLVQRFAAEEGTTHRRGESRDAEAAIPSLQRSITPTLHFSFLRQTCLALREASDARQLPDTINTFENLWREALAGEIAGPLRVCEAACGSANDYRFISSYRIGRFLDYTGLDISAKNIANAAEMFPGIRFQVGNAFELPLADGAVEACYFHDLLEHLSPEGLERAVAELCRVTSRALCAGLFSAYEGGEHVVRPMDEYHCNTLSLSQLAALFQRHGFTVRPVNVDSHIRRRFPGAEYHNPNAWTLYCTR